MAFPRNIEVIKKDFCNTLEDVAGRHRPYEIFHDWLEMAAISLHQMPYHAGDFSKDETFQNLEEKYLEVAGKYNREELTEIAKLMGLTIEALHTKPHDFLGDIYQEMEFSNPKSGQFFTPFPVSQMMAKMNMADVANKIQEKGIITVSDPACGAGGTLIAAALEVENQEIDPRQVLQFEAIDIDRDCFNMAYIQLSSLDLQAMVCHGHSLLRREIWEERATPQLMYFNQWRSQQQESLLAEERINKMLGLMRDLEQPSPEEESPTETVQERVQESESKAVSEPTPKSKPEADIVFEPQQLSLFDTRQFEQ